MSRRFDGIRSRLEIHGDAGLLWSGPTPYGVTRSALRFLVDLFEAGAVARRYGLFVLLALGLCSFATAGEGPKLQSETAGPVPGRVICMGNPPVCRGPTPAPVVTIDLADRMAGHAGALGLASAADLMTTSWALRRCPTCREANPLGADVEARVALKLGFGTAALGTCWLLERSNHSGWAKAVRWGATAIFAGAAVSNTVHAIRKR